MLPTNCKVSGVILVLHRTKNAAGPVIPENICFSIKILFFVFFSKVEKCTAIKDEEFESPARTRRFAEQGKKIGH